MASYEQLSAQQRAIVDLILKRGQSYDQLAETLGMTETRVRELAAEALTDLAPVSAASVDPAHRDELVDYLLNQAGRKTVAARSHLRRSESARAWSGSVLDSLEHLYRPGTLPTIPESGTVREPAAARRATPRAPLSPEARELVRRRRMIGGAVAALLLALIVFVWPIGVLTGGDDGAESSDDVSASGPELVGQVQLRPVAGARRGSQDAGIALVSRRRNGKFEIAIEARVPASRRNEAYQVWLYNSKTDNRLLGAQVANAQGVFAGRAPLPAEYRDYRHIDISKERIDREEGHSGDTVLRGPLAQLDAPAAGTETAP